MPPFRPSRNLNQLAQELYEDARANRERMLVEQREHKAVNDLASEIVAKFKTYSPVEPRFVSPWVYNSNLQTKLQHVGYQLRTNEDVTPEGVSDWGTIFLVVGVWRRNPFRPRNPIFVEETKALINSQVTFAEGHIDGDLGFVEVGQGLELPRSEAAIKSHPLGTALESTKQEFKDTRDTLEFMHATLSEGGLAQVFFE